MPQDPAECLDAVERGPRVIVPSAGPHKCCGWCCHCWWRCWAQTVSAVQSSLIPIQGRTGRLLFPRDHWSVVVIEVRLLESLDWWCIVGARKNAKRIQIGGEGGEINLRISHLLLWLGLATSSSSSPYPCCCISRSVRTS